MLCLWWFHHGFEGVWTKEPVDLHAVPWKSTGSATRKTPAEAGSSFSWMFWVFSGTFHPAAELPQAGCAPSSLSFSLGNLGA